MRDYIVMEDLSPEHYRVAIHEYTHLIVEHTGLKLPIWMNEGWAELYSTLKPMGGKTMIGDLIPGHVQTLMSEKWLDLNTLTSVTHDSPLYNEKNKAGMFYAESWALMHMLYLGEEYRPNFTKFVIAVASGKTADEAFQTAFGRSTAQVQKDLEGYLHRHRLFGAVFQVKLQKSEEEAEVSSPAPFDVEMGLADLLAATRKTDDARQRYEEIAKENPGRPEVEESLGYLMWQGGDSVSAREHFGKALAQGSRNARMCFDYAMLQRQAGAHPAAVIPALERAVEVKADYTEARLQLGLMRLNTREWAKAAAELGQIHKVNEEQAPWLFSGLAYAQAQLGRHDEARANAEKAKKWAKTPEQINRADELLRYLDAQKEAEAARTRAMSAQASAPAGNAAGGVEQTDATRFQPPAPSDSDPARMMHPREKWKRVQGTASKLECNGKQARFYVNVAGATMIFAIEDPGAVQLKHSGATTFEFKCGPQKPFAVAVEYAPSPEPSKGVVGVLRVLEF